MFAGSVQSFSSWGIGRALLDNVDFSRILRIHCTKNLLSSFGASGPESDWAPPFNNAYGLVMRMARQYARCKELLRNSNALLLPAEGNRSGRHESSWRSSALQQPYCDDLKGFTSAECPSYHQTTTVAVPFHVEGKRTVIGLMLFSSVLALERVFPGRFGTPRRILQQCPSTTQTGHHGIFG